MLNYPAGLKPDGDGYLVEFRDIPEAITSGRTKEEALEMAQDALATAMEFYFEDKRTVPAPSKAKRGESLVELPPSLAAKVLLLNLMIEQGVTAASLARRLDTTPQTVTRIVDIHHATKIDTLSEAFRALGKRLELRVV